MFRPRAARNQHGYVLPVPGSVPRRWETLLYYNDRAIKNPTDDCGSYTLYKSQDQGLSATRLVITEQ